MTEKEIQDANRRAAEKVMGWTAVLAGGEEWFDKYDNDRGKFPIFAYWPEGGSAVYMCGCDIDPKTWSPMTSHDDAFELLGKWLGVCKYRDSEIHIDRDTDGVEVKLFRDDGCDIWTIGNLPEAITLAVLQAAESEESNE